ncbi:MAG: hypothetical protein DMF90_06545 [Acidobacteria bacterium]|nr:MAG: hypothetical protein DMF90_06545 [Acidobacteriota bacterium]
MDLKQPLKRGALLAAANWPIVAVQFAAQTTFQALLAVPLIGAAILVAVLLGADLANLLQGSLREILTRIAGALMSEPVALIAFATAFAIALVGGSVLMFLVKGGAVEVMIAANDAAGPLEREPLSFRSVRQASRFTVARFVAGCGRLFKPYLRIGLALVVVYALSAAGYLAFLVYGYRAAGHGSSILGWTFLAALSTVPLVIWITLVKSRPASRAVRARRVSRARGDLPRGLRHGRRGDTRLGAGVVGGWVDCVCPPRGARGLPFADRRAALERARLRVHRPDIHGRLRHAVPPPCRRHPRAIDRAGQPAVGGLSGPARKRGGEHEPAVSIAGRG